MKDTLMSRNQDGKIVLAEILMVASRDLGVFAAVSRLSRNVTTDIEVSGIGGKSSRCLPGRPRITGV